MDVPVKIARSLRNHWKKSIFFSALAAYGVRYATRRLEDNEIRRLYCEVANKYGHEYIALVQKPRRATVFLNPAACDGSGRKLFEKNAAPILYLSGMDVNVVKTEYEGQAKEFMTALDSKDTDLIVVAGGDGLLAEVVGGIMKKNDRTFERSVPIAVIPLGKTNRFFRLLFGDHTPTVQSMCDAAMTVIQGEATRIDVMEIMASDGKQTYALSGLEFGAYRDASARKNKYWYFGPLKSRWTHMRSVMKQWPPSINAHLSYISAETAESVRMGDDYTAQNTSSPQTSWSWINLFYKPAAVASDSEDDYEDEVDVAIGDEHLTDVEVSTVEFTAMSSNFAGHKTGRKLISIGIGPSDPSRMDYLKEGLRRVKAKSMELGSDLNRHLAVERIRFIPEIIEGKESWYTIDGEQYEAKPVHIQLLRNRLTFLRPPAPPTPATATTPV